MYIFAAFAVCYIQFIVQGTKNLEISSRVAGGDTQMIVGTLSSECYGLLGS